MLTPGVGGGVPRYDLLGAYYQFNPNRRGFVASRVLPPVEVPGRQGHFGVVPRAALLAYISTKRAAKGNVSQSEWTPSSDSFEIDEFTHQIPVDYQEVDRYGGWFDMHEMAAMLVAGVIETDIERDCATKVMNDTTFPADGVTGATVGTAWSTWASATPIADMITGFTAGRDNFGVEYNALICPRRRYDDICNTAEFRDRAKYVGVTPARMDAADFRRVLGSALADDGSTDPETFQLILPWGRYNTANPSAASPTLASIWPTNRAMLTRIEPGPNWMVPQLGRQFLRAIEPEIQTYQTSPKGEFVLGTQHKQNKIMTNAPAYMFRGIGS